VMRSVPAHPITTKGDHAAVPALNPWAATPRLHERRSHDLAQPALTRSPSLSLRPPEEKP